VQIQDYSYEQNLCISFDQINCMAKAYKWLSFSLKE